MSSKYEAIEKILKQEGGYVNHPKDPGGETKYGISKRMYPNLDIKNISEDEARFLYGRDYWDKYHLDTIKDDRLAISLFSMVVNMGAKQAFLLLQRAINNKTRDKITVDGIFGGNTLKYCNSMDNLNTEFLKECIKFYVSLAMKDKNKEVFLEGWINRAFDLI